MGARGRLLCDSRAAAVAAVLLLVFVSSLGLSVSALLPRCLLWQPALRLTAPALAFVVLLLQDWDAQQKAQRERILAGWKPEDEEDEDKDSGA